jgi:multidrug efflux pump subunit AcrB
MIEDDEYDGDFSDDDDENPRILIEINRAKSTNAAQTNKAINDKIQKLEKGI